ncbi:rhomboid family intramembrane serine protease [Candidatus Dojkabacteria bacterium]|nr:rhomboid family intramembrane serine protease [Candidatus Dojkabacteria bacterium]
MNRLEIKLNWLTALLGINIFMFIISAVMGLVFGEGALYSLLFLGAESSQLILSGQAWRMITSAFLHANFIHIAANMYVLFQLGGYVERFFGGKKLLTVYILTAIGASALSVTANLSGFQSAGISVGASGAVFGLVGFVFISSWKSERNSFHVELPLDYRQLIPFIILNLIFSILIPGINLAAHVGGFIGGSLLAFVLKPAYGFVSATRDLTGDILFYISLALLIFSFVGLIVFNISIF